MENGEIILKETKKELPKTWEECYLKLGNGEYIENLSIINSDIQLINTSKSNKNMLPVGLGKPMLAMMQLLVCRDVYRDGWKPDWNDDKDKYCIEIYRGEIYTDNYAYSGHVLSFQSRAVRDEFLSNFRDLIEDAKELL